MRVSFRSYILGQATQLFQVGVTNGVHRGTLSRFRPTDELAQRSQVRQAGNAATPYDLRTAVVLNLDECPKVAYQRFRTSFEKDDELVARLSPLTRFAHWNELSGRSVYLRIPSTCTHHRPARS